MIGFWSGFIIWGSAWLIIGGWIISCWFKFSSQKIKLHWFLGSPSNWIDNLTPSLWQFQLTHGIIYRFMNVHHILLEYTWGFYLFNLVLSLFGMCIYDLLPNILKWKIVGLHSFHFSFVVVWWIVFVGRQFWL